MSLKDDIVQMTVKEGLRNTTLQPLEDGTGILLGIEEAQVKRLTIVSLRRPTLPISEASKIVRLVSRTAVPIYMRADG